jgi:hypothetical protein
MRKTAAREREEEKKGGRREREREKARESKQASLREEGMGRRERDC